MIKSEPTKKSGGGTVLSRETPGIKPWRNKTIIAFSISLAILLYCLDHLRADVDKKSDGPVE